MSSPISFQQPKFSHALIEEETDVDVNAAGSVAKVEIKGISNPAVGDPEATPFFLTTRKEEIADKVMTQPSLKVCSVKMHQTNKATQAHPYRMAGLGDLLMQGSHSSLDDTASSVLTTQSAQGYHQEEHTQTAATQPTMAASFADLSYPQSTARFRRTQLDNSYHYLPVVPRSSAYVDLNSQMTLAEQSLYAGHNRPQYQYLYREPQPFIRFNDYHYLDVAHNPRVQPGGFEVTEIITTHHIPRRQSPTLAPGHNIESYHNASYFSPTAAQRPSATSGYQRHHQHVRRHSLPYFQRAPYVQRELHIDRQPQARASYHYDNNSLHRPQHVERNVRTTFTQRNLPPHLHSRTAQSSTSRSTTPKPSSTARRASFSSRHSASPNVTAGQGSPKTEKSTSVQHRQRRASTGSIPNTSLQSRQSADTNIIRSRSRSSSPIRATTQDRATSPFQEQTDIFSAQTDPASRRSSIDSTASEKSLHRSVRMFKLSIQPQAVPATTSHRLQHIEQNAQGENARQSVNEGARIYRSSLHIQPRVNLNIHPERAQAVQRGFVRYVSRAQWQHSSQARPETTNPPELWRSEARIDFKKDPQTNKTVHILTKFEPFRLSKPSAPEPRQGTGRKIRLISASPTPSATHTPSVSRASSPSLTPAPVKPEKKSSSSVAINLDIGYAEQERQNAKASTPTPSASPRPRPESPSNRQESSGTAALKFAAAKAQPEKK